VSSTLRLWIYTGFYHKVNGIHFVVKRVPEWIGEYITPLIAYRRSSPHAYGRAKHHRPPIIQPKLNEGRWLERPIGVEGCYATDPRRPNSQWWGGALDNVNRGSHALPSLRSAPTGNPAPVTKGCVPFANLCTTRGRGRGGRTSGRKRARRLL
jgi:hypothetical protein